jgi:hypothetical protein
MQRHADDCPAAGSLRFRHSSLRAAFRLWRLPAGELSFLESKNRSKNRVPTLNSHRIKFFCRKTANYFWALYEASHHCENNLFRKTNHNEKEHQTSADCSNNSNTIAMRYNMHRKGTRPVDSRHAEVRLERGWRVTGNKSAPDAPPRTEMLVAHASAETIGRKVGL